ncbi:MAG: hypothetical protein WC273_03130 [Dehalococcoidia bacterium]
MTLQPVLLCTQCGARIEGAAITLGEERFCCLGCVGGGPCICDRQNTDSLILRVGPFSSQADLLRFAARLERAPGLLHVAMTHASLEEARFAIDAPSTEVLALAVEADPDHSISVETSGTTVIGHVDQPRRPRPTASVDGLLPARTRFRVFRTPSEQPPVGGDSAPAPDQPPRPRDAHDSCRDERPGPGRPATNEAHAAALLAGARQAATPAHPLAPSAQSPARHAGALRIVSHLDPAPAQASPVQAPPVQPSPQPAGVHEVVIVASPFHSFLALNEFQGAIRAIPGVRDTRVRRFYGGTLNLSVEYADSVPLVDRMRAAPSEAWQIVSASPDRIEIALTEAGSLAGLSDR